MKQILVIEDDPLQQEMARRQLGEFALVSSFKDFQEIFSKEKFSGILSDLYFPNNYGYDSQVYQSHKNESISAIESYAKGRDFSTPFLNAIELVFKRTVAMDDLENIVSDMKNVGFIVNKETSSMLSQGIKKRDELRKYNSLISEISSDAHLLPEGMFVYRVAHQHSIPCVIVTSEYHHGFKFQPFTSKVGTYVDRVENGEKAWKEAYTLLNG